MSEPNPDAVWMYDQGGLSCAEIAPMFGVSESTVKRWMRAAGVMRAGAGRPLQDTCHNDHDLNEWRRRDKSGNPYCLLCKRTRDQANWKKRTLAKKNEPKKPTSGKVSESFSKPNPVEPGTCRICGSNPPCKPH